MEQLHWICLQGSPHLASLAKMGAYFHQNFTVSSQCDVCQVGAETKGMMIASHGTCFYGMGLWITFCRGKFWGLNKWVWRNQRHCSFWSPKLCYEHVFGHVCFNERRDERLTVEQHFIAILFAKQMWALILEYDAITKPIVLDVIDGVSWFSVLSKVLQPARLTGQ